METASGYTLYLSGIFSVSNFSRLLVDKDNVNSPITLYVVLWVDRYWVRRYNTGLRRSQTCVKCH
jgi:hypothetical protein